MAVLQSAATTDIATVDATMDGLRVVIKPDELTGAFQIAQTTGAIAAATAAGTLFSFRWAPGTGQVCVIKRVSVAVASANTTLNTAAQVGIGMYVARGFIASDSGGTALAPLATGAGRYRTTHLTSNATDIRIATTAVLTAGTRTLDANTLGSTYFYATAAVGTYLPLTNLVAYNVSDYPLVLQNNEGFTINNLTAMPALGSSSLFVNVEWFETTSY
jgi:hypothetical protein